MTRPRLCLPALLSLWMVLLSVGTARAQGVEFFPVEDLREGMTGVGRTVFSGTRVEEFGVEIIGVLRNSAPRQDMILARLSGGRLAETGVLQGMSGSPVYIDGRLVGAVAFAFDSSTEPIAGIQPIAQMVSVLDAPAAVPVARGAFPEESVASFVNRIRTGDFGPEAGAYSFYPLGTRPGPRVERLAAAMQPIRTPLFMSGLSTEALGAFSGVFEAFGFSPVQGGAGGAGTARGGAAAVVPGASINAEMVRGDISVSANGTVTHVDGDRVYAFGHPFQSTGPVDMPMSLAEVLAVVPTRTVSFKVAVPSDLVGRFQQDRSTGVMGSVGTLPEMIPVTVDLVTSRGVRERYEYEIIEDRMMTPLMMNLTLFELILATERSLGDLTLEIAGEVHLRNGQTVSLHAAYAGELNSQALTATSTSAPITYLIASGFDELAIESIDIELRSSDTRRLARLDAVRVDRGEVRAGEMVTLEAVLRTVDGGEIIQAYPFRVPAGTPPGTLQLVVGDGVSVSSSDLRRSPGAPPRSVAQIVGDLNSLRRMDRLYLRLLSPSPGAVVRGQELPSLPPSMLAMIRSARSADSRISETRSSPVGEFEIGPSDYVIQGQQTLSLTVVR